MKKVVEFYWKVRIFFLAIKWIFRTNLGDVVKYNGKEYEVCNGHRYGQWRLEGVINGNDGWVPRKDCKKVWSYSNFKRSFESGRSFYMQNWFSIWCDYGIKPWMRGCKIW